MNWNFLFFFNSALLGVGLAMDAFSVSIANGIHEPDMKRAKALAVAGTFAFFQYAMPLIGWLCVHTIVQYFSKFEKFIPWIALLLLLYIGGKMLIEGIRGKTDPEESTRKGGVTFAVLMVQGVATSIDALSVGFTIAEYDLLMANVCALLIAAVTFGICMAGVKIGKKVGTLFASKAGILGGAILIGIGIEIFVKGVFF